LTQRVLKYHNEQCKFKEFSIKHKKDPTEKDFRQFIKWYLRYSSEFIGGIVANTANELDMQLAIRGY